VQLILYKKKCWHDVEEICSIFFYPPWPPVAGISRPLWLPSRARAGNVLLPDGSLEFPLPPRGDLVRSVVVPSPILPPTQRRAATVSDLFFGHISMNFFMPRLSRADAWAAGDEFQLVSTPTFIEWVNKRRV